MAEVKVFRLYQLCESVRRLIEKATGGQRFWVTCEIVRINERRGHRYLELVDMEGEEEIARMSGVMWGSMWNQLLNKYGEDLGNILSNGKKVLVQCGIEYHELYGLKLQLYDVDASYTIGDLESRKRATLEKLEKEGLLRLNAGKKLPLVIKKVGIVSSPKAAGYEDFINHLTKNTYSYGFSLKLFEASVQGASAEAEVCRAIAEAQDYNLDVLVIIRGGGSRLDLEVFNAYSIANAIAHSRLPVITGIGHESDEVVADLASHTRQKTPTAAAHFILERNMDYEARMQWGFERIRKEAGLSLRRERDLLNVSAEKYMRMVQTRLLREESRLQKMKENLRRSPTYLLLGQKHLQQQIAGNIAREIRQTLASEHRSVGILKEQLRQNGATGIRSARQAIGRAEEAMRTATLRRLKAEHRNLDQGKALIRMVHPDNILRKGFAILSTSTGVVMKAEDLKEGQDFEVMAYHFELEARALKIKKRKHGKEDR